ncbi:MAG: hypothetical protein GY773_17975 [Actinomycetia bacterium]|nr:hypothetical protein [Actinomycetes bacterium]
MTERSDLEALAKGEDSDTDLVKTLRGALAAKVENWVKPEDHQALQADNAKLQRRIALDSAGLPDDSFGAYFAERYDGEPTVEAIQAAAIEAGVIQPLTTEAGPAEQQVAAQIETAASAPAAAPPDLLEQVHAAEGPEELKALLATHNIPVHDEIQG